MVGDGVVESAAEVRVAGVLYAAHQIGCAAVVTSNHVISNGIAAASAINGVFGEHAFLFGNQAVGQFEGGAGWVAGFQCTVE